MTGLFLKQALLTSSLLVLLIVIGQPTAAGDEKIPPQAKTWSEVSTESVAVHSEGNRVWLTPKANALESGEATITRLAAPIRSIQWLNAPEQTIKFWPEQDEWVFSWKEEPPAPAVIEVVFDRTPVLPSDSPAAEPAGDGSIMLHAYQASTFGEKLRFEPQWYKNTVGYWTVPTDYATWDLHVGEPGTYSVALLQGCGKGQGGSDAMLSVRQGDDVTTQLPFKTVETGHFQNFRWNHLGLIEIDESGEYELRIAPERIANKALFDVRMIHLVKQAEATK